ncbi:unnamed protein product [Acanthosepion pharaonis]|uniref:Uncharacterized protein n=1 Tax=Acanthosepion pharaonis TaxID=158019 RepID=A0A812EKN6_ACAPH|nr:unnamed protein product [Sepia pharaonis]
MLTVSNVSLLLSRLSSLVSLSIHHQFSLLFFCSLNNFVSPLLSTSPCQPFPMCLFFFRSFFSFLHHQTQLSKRLFISVCSFPKLTRICFSFLPPPSFSLSLSLSLCFSFATPSQSFICVSNSSLPSFIVNTCLFFSYFFLTPPPILLLSLPLPLSDFKFSSCFLPFFYVNLFFRRSFNFILYSFTVSLYFSLFNTLSSLSLSFFLSFFLFFLLPIWPKHVGNIEI